MAHSPSPRALKPRRPASRSKLWTLPATKARTPPSRSAGGRPGAAAPSERRGGGGGGRGGTAGGGGADGPRHQLVGEALGVGEVQGDRIADAVEAHPRGHPEELEPRRPLLEGATAGDPPAQAVDHAGTGGACRRSGRVDEAEGGRSLPPGAEAEVALAAIVGRVEAKHPGVEVEALPAGGG